MKKQTFTLPELVKLACDSYDNRVIKMAIEYAYTMGAHDVVAEQVDKRLADMGITVEPRVS